MRHRRFLTKRIHIRSYRPTRRHPRYHHSHSRRARLVRSTVRRRRGGSNKNMVVANSKGRVRFLHNMRNPLQNANTVELPGNDDI
jgi:hypothetical protein